MERKKRSKGRGWESCYVKKFYGTFGVEMRSYGQKLVKLCTHTHTRVSYSSIDSLGDWIKVTLTAEVTDRMIGTDILFFFSYGKSFWIEQWLP